MAIAIRCCAAVDVPVTTHMMEVATLPAVVHAEVSASCRGVEVVAPSVVVAASAYHMPGMSATIAGIEHRASEVEVVAVWIAGVDTEVPVAVAPVEWAVEIAGGDERVPLPVQQHVAQVLIAPLPVSAVHVVITGHPHQVVQIDFVGCLILLVGQVQLVGHLVRQEQSLVACLLVAHCIARSCESQHHCQGYHHLFHSRKCYVVRH